MARPKNTSFKFKQFTINQEMTAMKVCTDSCLFGALIETGEASSVLDIGTGTGLLALMLAQKTEAIIDAVEVDHSAYNQALINFKNSPWSDRLRLYHEDFNIFWRNIDRKYELIISNPPFFSNNLKSEDEKRNVALHNDILNQEQLLKGVVELLSEIGLFYVLLPYYEAELLEKKAEIQGLYCSGKWYIKNNPGTEIIRSVSKFSFAKNQNYFIKEISIRDFSNCYTYEFKELLKDYYLIF